MKRLANKVVFMNTVTGLREIEVCDNERLDQLRGFPFIVIETIQQVREKEDFIAGIGGNTPAFKKTLVGLF